MLQNRAVFAVVAWSFLIWTTRIGNIWSDAELDTAAKWGRTGLALSFTVLAAAVIVAFWYGERGGVRRAVLALCGWTVAVWTVRSVAILFGDWSASFKVVHLVLGAVSIALAVLATRSLRLPRIARHPVPASGSGSHHRL